MRRSSNIRWLWPWMHDAIWNSKGFSRKFAGLEKGGAIRAVEQNMGNFFEGSEPAARYCVFRKTWL